MTEYERKKLVMDLAKEATEARAHRLSLRKARLERSLLEVAEQDRHLGEAIKAVAEFGY